MDSMNIEKIEKVEQKRKIGEQLYDYFVGVRESVKMKKTL